MDAQTGCIAAQEQAGAYTKWALASGLDSRMIPQMKVPMSSRAPMMLTPSSKRSVQGRMKRRYIRCSTDSANRTMTCAAKYRRHQERSVGGLVLRHGTMNKAVLNGMLVLQQNQRIHRCCKLSRSS